MTHGLRTLACLTLSARRLEVLAAICAGGALAANGAGAAGETGGRGHERRGIKKLGSGSDDRTARLHR